MNNDQQVTQAVFQLIQSGHIAEARKLVNQVQSPMMRQMLENQLKSFCPGCSA